MTGLLRAISSLRLTAALILAFSALLMLGVIVPQAAVVGETAMQNAVAEGGGVRRFFLETLGLARLHTSPLFLALLALFFVNLVAVLTSRTGPTMRRIRMRVPDPEPLKRWVASPDALVAPLPVGWTAAGATSRLRGFGYRAIRAGDDTIWAVRHRAAPFGFVLLHVSFIVLLVGAILIYYTRAVGSARLIEGQTWEGIADDLRRPPAGRPDRLAFTLTSVEPRFEKGEPAGLGVSLRMPGGQQRSARVNYPAQWGATTILVTDVGVAPVLWLQDAQGFALDKVAAAAEHDRPTRVSMAGNRYLVTINPDVSRENFPSREALGRVPVEVEVRDGATVLGRVQMTPGQTVQFGDARLVISDMRYWAGLRIVSERGGSVLVLGFVAGVAGAVWRLVLHRREIALQWNGESMRLTGRAEFFGLTFREELESLLEALQTIETKETI